jgi:hypothetical protein
MFSQILYQLHAADMCQAWPISNLGKLLGKGHGLGCQQEVGTKPPKTCRTNEEKQR